MQQQLPVRGLGDVEPIKYCDRLVSLRARHVHLRVGIDKHGGNVVEDVAVVVAGGVGDVDDVHTREPLLGLGLRTLNQGRGFMNIDRFLDLL